tara:strand:- start:394 stop:669 length:276 start_codon:yes stop_codon:yes gene_type:complete
MDSKLIIEELDIDLETRSDKTTENEYLEMANDFKERMNIKNFIINKLQKKLIVIYGLIDRFMETDDDAFIEETKLILDKVLIQDIGIQDIS